MEEPTVLDYLKAKLMPWRGQKIEIPPIEQPLQEPFAPQKTSPAAEPASQAALATSVPLSRAAVAGVALPWRSLLALTLALLAQISLEPGPNRTWGIGVILYGAAFLFLGWSFWRSEWIVAQLKVEVGEQSALSDLPSGLILRRLPFYISLAMGLLAFLTFGGNRFTGLNVSIWALALVAFLRAFWQSLPGTVPWWQRLWTWLKQPQWQLSLGRGTLLFLLATMLVLFFRLHRIEQVPPEMVSDHAEKLLDIWDVLNGQTSIFFPRNTGREAMQMYLTAAIIRFLGTGFSFLSLKIGTVLAGLLTLPYIYLLGKEVGNPRVGLWAFVFAGIAYWPNVISRVGLRFPLYPLFVAPTLYYLVRGLRRGRLNDFILAGLALGLGLHGYTPIRILPFVVVIAVGLYLLHHQRAGMKAQAVRGLAVLSLAALMLSLPLLRYAIENPEMFSYRSLTRLAPLEQPLPGPAWQIFLNNLWRAMTMFAWDDGEIWVHSVMHRPALDVVSAGLFYLGLGLLFLRYLRQRNWQDLFWMLSIPLLMMPSILSLAFPAENPALNRMGGAIVPVFLIIGLSLDGLLTAIQRTQHSLITKGLAWGLGLFLLLWASVQNYDLVFRQYQDYYRLASWNTSEMGAVIRAFAASVGDPETAWVVAYPYWVDTRLVGMNAGYPTKDYAIWPEDLAETVAEPRAKLFLVNREDTAALQTLSQLYPQGSPQLFTSQVEGHDFYLYFVPPQK